MFAPRVVPFGLCETEELEKIRFVAGPGTSGWFAPPEVATQLLWLLPLEAAQTPPALLRPPFQ